MMLQETHQVSGYKAKISSVTSVFNSTYLILTCVLRYPMAIPMIVENAWVTENILPSWVGGTHFDKIDVDGVDLLPLKDMFQSFILLPSLFLYVPKS